jgi:hypothetical protein
MDLTIEVTVGVEVAAILAKGVGLATTVGLRVTWGVAGEVDFFFFALLVVLLEEEVVVEMELFWVEAAESSANA